MKRQIRKGGSLASQLMAQAAAHQSETAFVRLPIPEIAPDFVFEFQARRVSIQSMLVAAILPESLAKMILEIRTPDAVAKIEEDASLEAESMSTEDQFKILEFQRTIACEVCADPVLVIHEPKQKNEVDLRTIPFADKLVKALYSYAMGLSPAVPVPTTEGGETTVEAVETFHQVPELPDPRTDGASVRANAQ